MKIVNVFVGAVLAVGAAFVAAEPAAAMPFERPAVAAHSDVVQVRHWRDDDYRYERRGEWRRDHHRRYWRPWRAERWEHSRYWRPHHRYYRPWVYRY
jgi:hypothetical protein